MDILIFHVNKITHRQNKYRDTDHDRCYRSIQHMHLLRERRIGKDLCQNASSSLSQTSCAAKACTQVYEKIDTRFGCLNCLGDPFGARNSA